MEKLQRSDLFSLEQYAEHRSEMRKKVIAHKKNRRIAIGDHVQLLFEDRLLMQYQIQEMLRIEKIFEPAEIQEELDAYNPLIPDGQNLKATMMVEYSDPEERKEALKRLRGLEQSIWIQIGELDKIFPIANEDLERTTDEKTSAVHFLRFELSQDMIAALKGKASLKAGTDHEAYNHDVIVSDQVRESLTNDLE